MILFLQIFISTNLPAHTDNPLRFKTRNKYAVLREKEAEVCKKEEQKTVTNTDRGNGNRAELGENKRAEH